MTMLTITAGVNRAINSDVSSNHDDGDVSCNDDGDGDNRHVAIEMVPSVQPSINDQIDYHAYLDVDDNVPSNNDNSNDDDVVDYGNIYSSTSHAADDVMQYNDMSEFRSSLLKQVNSDAVEKSVARDQVEVSAGTVTSVVVSKSKAVKPATSIDVDNMSFADLLKQYKLERVQEQEHVDETVNDRLFEEWKISKRKQFKEGTRSTFVEAYNTYEDLFSKNTYQSAKEKEKEKQAFTTTVNPLLSSSRAAAAPGTEQGVEGVMDSAAHTRRLFKEQSFKSRISFDQKYKKK